MTSSNENQLQSYFEKSAYRVRRAFERVEQDYAFPAMQFGAGAFKKYPITATFLATFALLSILPVLSFIAFSVFVLTSLIFTALFLALVVSSLAIAFFSSLLIAVLSGLAILSAGISAIVISTYLSVRLFVLVRADGRAGLSEWSDETKSRFIRGESEERRGRRTSTGSAGSIVIVGKESEKGHSEVPPSNENQHRYATRSEKHDQKDDGEFPL